jgi:hypothetical protein
MKMKTTGHGVERKFVSELCFSKFLMMNTILLIFFHFQIIKFIMMIIGRVLMVKLQDQIIIGTATTKEKVANQKKKIKKNLF